MENQGRAIDELEFENFIIGNSVYHFSLSDKVKAELRDGRISTDQIEQTIFHIPNGLYKELGNEDFLMDCQHTGIRLIVSKADQNFEILLARIAEELPIY